MSGGATVNYAWDVAGALPVILDDGTYRYVYGLDLIAAIEDGGTGHYFLYDGLGSVTEVTDAIGGVEASFRYDIFGAVRSSSGSTDLEFRFTGEQLDPSGLYFLRARYYDPATGRFISRDLVEFGQRYAYGYNNPMLIVDPSGALGWPKVSYDLCGKTARAVQHTAVDTVRTVRDGVVACASDSTCQSVLGAAAVVGGTAIAQPWLVGIGTVVLTASDIQGCTQGSGVSCALAAVDVATLGVTSAAARGVTANVSRAALRGSPHEAMLQFSSKAPYELMQSPRFGVTGAIGGTGLGVAERLGLLGNTQIRGRTEAAGYAGSGKE